MAKDTPHCKLQRVRHWIEAGLVRMSYSALKGASALGLDREAMLAVVTGLSSHDFYKRMTTHRDHTIWQDVYRPITPYGGVNLKLAVIGDVLIVFKESRT